MRRAAAVLLLADVGVRRQIVAFVASRQIRLPGDGNAGRRLTITPDWAAAGATPKPWVAYASTVDGYTGDAHSAHRVPAGTRLR